MVIGVTGNTIEIMGKQFLRCERHDCEWNVGWLGGLEWTEDRSGGTRVCNLGAKAIIETKAIPPVSCPQPKAVFELAYAEVDF